MPKPWSINDLDYLQEKWGTSSLPTLSKILGRTQAAIKIKATRLGLGPFLDSGEYITLNILFKNLGCKAVSQYAMTSWVKNRGFPIKYKQVFNNKFKVVKIDDFWEWAEKNRHFFDFSKLEKNVLGKEPDWVETQRKIDTVRSVNIRTEPWSQVEDERLKFLLKRHKYSFDDLSNDLKRSTGAIQRRILDLGIVERPIKAKAKKWTDAQIEIVKLNIKNGVSYDSMAKDVGKSSKAIRGKIYAMYGTESADKVRQILKKEVKS